MFWQFLFKLFRLDYEPEICLSCEHLKMLIESEKRLNKQLLDSILNKSENISAREDIIPQPIPSKHTPFAVVRAKLEKESREKARILKKQSIEELENELGVNDEVSSVAEREDIREEKEVIEA